jgi:DNA polymerase I
MVAVHNAMKDKNLQSRMILQVHDELVFDVHIDEMDTIKTLVKTAMEHAIKITVPMEVEMEIGDNWLDAH